MCYQSEEIAPFHTKAVKLRKIFHISCAEQPIYIVVQNPLEHFNGRVSLWYLMQSMAFQFCKWWVGAPVLLGWYSAFSPHCDWLGVDLYLKKRFIWSVPSSVQLKLTDHLLLLPTYFLTLLNVTYFYNNLTTFFNLNFPIRKMAFSNFVEPPQSDR